VTKNQIVVIFFATFRKFFVNLHKLFKNLFCPNFLRNRVLKIVKRLIKIFFLFSFLFYFFTLFSIEFQPKFARDRKQKFCKKIIKTCLIFRKICSLWVDTLVTFWNFFYPIPAKIQKNIFQFSKKSKQNFVFCVAKCAFSDGKFRDF